MKKTIWQENLDESRIAVERGTNMKSTRLMRSSMKRALTKAFFLLLPAVMCGCDNPRLCPEGLYRNFEPDWVQGYKITPDEVTIWLVAKPLDGTLCLPRDLTVRNLVTPEGFRVSIQPSGWIKGRPLMAVYIRGVADANQTISFDVYQGEAKKQTVRISITKAPYLIVSINGKQLKSDRD